MKKVVFFIFLISLFILTTGITAAANEENESIFDDRVKINIKNFGAKGNGISDDTSAIQRAIDYASMRDAVVFFPESETSYVVTKTLLIKDNTAISGYGAEVFMASKDKVTNLFLTNYNDYVTNVEIKGITISSSNDRDGNKYAEGGMTSNVTGLHFTGVSNLVLEDVVMNDMYVGLNFGAGVEGKTNENITAKNVEINRSIMPVLMNTTSGFIMTDSRLDASAGINNHLHSVYIDKNTSDITFDNVIFENSPGAGVQIYNGYTGTNPSENVKILNSEVINSRIGITIYSGASNIVVENVTFTETDLGFNIKNAFEVTLTNIEINDPRTETEIAYGAFKINNLYNSTISNVKVDSEGFAGRLFYKYGEQVDVVIENVNMY